MDLEAKKLIQEQYAKLPAILQQAIQSADLHQKISSIGQKNQLHIDQTGQLEDETLMLMMGFVDPDEFAITLQRVLNIDQIKALGVANDVGEKILLPIRERMKGNSSNNLEFSETVQNPPAVSAAPISAAPAPAPVAASAAAPAPIVPPKPVVPPLATTAAPAAPTPASLVVQAKPLAPADAIFSQPTISLAPKAAPTPASAPAPMSALVTPSSTPIVNAPSNIAPAASAPAPAPAPKTEPALAPKPATPPPTNYKADPYREPIEP